jgi:hypothetical protein
LLTTLLQNFDFNAKFPDHDALCDNCDKRGFADPTGRTDRVFRHSDHKCEMTAAEFESWATGAAHDWGYSVEISGVGTSNKPSYYKAKDGQPPRPVYASQTAVFRLETGIALRSPRSVRTVELPFMRGSSEAVHPHRLAAKKVHPATAVRAPGAPLPPAAVAAAIADVYASISVPTISLAELWGHEGVAAACGGSQRHLVASLGGWGDVPPLHDASTAFSVARTGTGLVVTRR